ncbi:hypothetical protein, partial [Adlercreutzia sp. ZJ473]
MKQTSGLEALLEALKQSGMNTDGVGGSPFGGSPFGGAPGGGASDGDDEGPARSAGGSGAGP